MTDSKTRPFYFLHNNTLYTFNRLSVAIAAAEKRVLTSISKHIKIYSSSFEECVAYSRETSRDNFITVFKNRDIYDQYISS